MDQRERWKKVMDLVVAVESFNGPLDKDHWPLRELLQALNWLDFGYRAERACARRMKAYRSKPAS